MLSHPACRNLFARWRWKWSRAFWRRPATTCPDVVPPPPPSLSMQLQRTPAVCHPTRYWALPRPRPRVVVKLLSVCVVRGVRASRGPVTSQVTRAS